MSITAMILIALLLLVCGFGYIIYSWLQVPPIDITSGASDAERIATIDRWLTQLSEKLKFNGGVLVIIDGKVSLSNTYGFTDHTASEKLDAHSAFQLASVSKQFTAAGVLRLAEKGLLNLDDPVNKYLAPFPFENVSIRHLLNQTSGIPDRYMQLAKQHRKSIGDVLTTSKVVELVAKYSKAARAPGEAMEYSNTNYILLAAVVESITGLSFEQYMSQELFQPLGMSDTRVWNLVSKDRAPNQTSDFLQFGRKRVAIKTPWLDGVAGDGAVYCSLHDFVIWDQFWNGNQLVSDSLLQQALKQPTLHDGTKSDYGFGWGVEPNYHHHAGAWLGAFTYIARYPSSKKCLVILDNSCNLFRFDKIVKQIEGALQLNG